MKALKALHILIPMTLIAAAPGLAPAVDDDDDDDDGRVRAELSGVNENPIVLSAGNGTFRARLRGDSIRFTLDYEDLAGPGSDVTQAHIHVGNPWDNGGVAVFLCSNLGNTPGNVTFRACPPSPGRVEGRIVAGDVLPASPLGVGDLEGLKQLLTGGAAYINVHSDRVPAGEIRGQTNPRRR